MSRWKKRGALTRSIGEGERVRLGIAWERECASPLIIVSDIRVGELVETVSKSVKREGRSMEPKLRAEATAVESAPHHLLIAKKQIAGIVIGAEEILILYSNGGLRTVKQTLRCLVTDLLQFRGKRIKNWMNQKENQDHTQMGEGRMNKEAHSGFRSMRCLL